MPCERLKMTPVSYIKKCILSQRAPVPETPLKHDSALGAIARAFVDARLQCRPLTGYPGVMPAALDAAYAIQDIAISLWPDELAGWKVGAIPPALLVVYGEERIIGPVFRTAVKHASIGVEQKFPVFVGGFAAVEAEFVFEIATDAQPGKVDWTPEQAADTVAAMYIGMEPASSPLATINEIGPVAIVSDFGNNAGLLLGLASPDWRGRLANGITCETSIDGVCVGRGGTARLPGGPLGALAFALNRCARLGRPLRAGALITTGAATGIHDVVAGQSARLVFQHYGELLCRAVAATPSSSTADPRAVESDAAT